MKSVIDSSIVVKWFVDEPGRDSAVGLLDESGMFIAPDILLAEVANALWRKVRSGLADVDQAEKAISEIAAMIILRPMDADLMQASLRLARQLEHSVYDCVFLACAISEGAELVTADSRFYDKLRQVGTDAKVRILT